MGEFQTHNLKVGDKVRVVGVERHPFAAEFLRDGDITVVVDATPFADMPCVEIAPTKGLIDDEDALAYGGDAGGVPFANHDLRILIKVEEGE